MLENRPGFLLALLQAYGDQSANPQGRYLAVLMCKNVLARHWQPRSSLAQGQGVTDEEKQQAKQLLLSLIRAVIAGETPHFLELTLVLRKMCRMEFPQRWDACAQFIITELQHIQQTGFSDSSLFLIVVVHHVLKEQVTKVAMRDRKDFHQIGQVFMGPLSRLWCALLDTMRQAPNIDPTNDRIWKLSRYLDGCFLILLSKGFAHLHEQNEGPDMVLAVKENLNVELMSLHC